MRRLAATAILAAAIASPCPADDKRLLMIPRANHNDIFARGLSQYLAAVKELMSKLSGPGLMDAPSDSR